MNRTASLRRSAALTNPQSFGLAIALALGLAAPGFALAGSPDGRMASATSTAGKSAAAATATGKSSTASKATSDIVDTAVAAGQFTTLAAALKAAGLVDTLKGKGPFTVFAPTDAAFAALPAGTVEDLLKPANRDKLVAVLTYHVVPGSYPAARVSGMDSATTVNGDSVDIRSMNGAVTVDGAKVVTADVKASNGVIHVIDKVLMPGG